MGETPIPANVSSKLHCRYWSNDHPWLKIGPIKTEEASIDPKIFIFHDLLFDKEIIKIKRHAGEKGVRLYI